MERSEHQKRVDKFMKLAGQEVPNKPVIPDEKTRLLRAKLILEEASELIKGLGFQIIALIDESIIVDPSQKYEPNLVEISDGIADVIVVTTGTASACGINSEAVQILVDENNLAKFGPGGYRRRDGKWVKPKNHLPPNIKEELESQRKQDNCCISNTEESFSCSEDNDEKNNKECIIVSGDSSSSLGDD